MASVVILFVNGFFFSSKYPLAIVEALLNAFGSDIGGGYDIGCKSKAMLASSPLGKKAKCLNYRFLVASMGMPTIVSASSLTLPHM